MRDIAAPEPPGQIQPFQAPSLRLANDTGGFSEDGREYVVVLRDEQETPAPWSNILANPRFGTLITASGSSFTWSDNSRENRLTPFANDAVADPTGEAIFIRNEETGESWGATPRPLPRARGVTWVVHHQAGAVQFERAGSQVPQTLDVFVPPADQVKVSRLTLTNASAGRLHLNVFNYTEWWLGPPTEGQQRHVVTRRDEQTGAILARNHYREERGIASRLSGAASRRGP